MRVLVCGSRTFTDRKIVRLILNGLDPTCVIEGGARGVDAMAAEWVTFFGPEPGPVIVHEQYPAKWDLHGKAAGPIRNAQMLSEGKPDIVVAFTDKPLEESRGTYDMCGRARSAEIPVYHVEVLA